MTKVILSVTNDLFCDQRVEKTAETLAAMGCNVLLVGRCYRNSPLPNSGNYSVKRLHLFFRKGALFYAEFNFRLFLFLLFQKCDILVSNDLDTLLPNLLISKLRRKKLVYDSHEYFCGILEIQNRPNVKKIWQKIEKFCFPKLNNIITVSQSIAEQYGKEYGKEVTDKYVPAPADLKLWPKAEYMQCGGCDNCRSMNNKIVCIAQPGQII